MQDKIVIKYCEKHNLPFGDYHYCASALENGFLSKGIAMLLDLDIPLSALRKLQRILAVTDGQPEKALRMIGTIDLEKYGLNQYEIRKIRTII